jgi:hypothetical protein
MTIARAQMNRQLYQMGGIGSLPMDYGQSLQVPQQMQPSFSSAQNITMNPLLNYGQTPLTMAGGGIANLVDREKYGLGSSLKKFVRNIIPNEVASIASAAAPFVAPFNPLLAAGMAGIGNFDKTGSIGGSLKSAALTYGGGQLGRYIGGSGFQTGFNPFDAASLGQSASSFIGVPYSSPIGTTTGLQLGQFTDAGNSAINQMEPYGGSATTGTLSKTPGTLDQLKTIFDPTSGVDFQTRAKTAMDLSGDAIKSMYTIPDGKGGTTLDKKAVISTLVAIPSYLDAKKKADQIGLSPSEFNEQIYNQEKATYQTAYQSRLPMESFGIRTTAAGGGMMDDAEGILSIKLTPAQGMAIGGRMGYADGTPVGGLMIKLDRPLQSGDTLGSYYDDGKGPLTPGFLNDSYGPVNSITGLRSIPVERKMGLFTNPDGSYFGENMPNSIQELPKSIMSMIQQQARAVSANPVNDLYKYYLENGTDEDYKRRIMESVKPRFGVAMGGEIPMRQNQSGVSELDLRAKGGYIPVGIKEKADDVPAMLSKNEFVFTADAVRAAGNGDINKGAQKMYKLMKSLEKKIKQNKVA